MNDPRWKARALVLATAVAAPAALGVETAARLLLLPPEFEEIRGFARPSMTWVAWGLVAVSALTVVIGLSVHQRLYDKAIARTPNPGPRHVSEAHVSAFLLSASVPQVPTLLSTLTFTFGAPLLPVVAGIAVSSVGVVLLGAKVWRA